MNDDEASKQAGQTPATVKDLSQEIGFNILNHFSEKALKAAYNPLHYRVMANPDSQARVQGSCGDSVTFYLQVDNGHIDEVTFITAGCDATIACSEILASLVCGMSLTEAEQITPEDLLMSIEGLPRNHYHCAVLAVTTLRHAVADFRVKQEM